MHLPGAEAWFGVRDGAKLPPGKAKVSAPLGTIPVFQRGGSVLPRQMRLRRASELMAKDPYTLIVAPDAAGDAVGELYLDAGDGFEYQTGAYALRRYTLSAGATLTSRALHASASYAPTNTLERLEILGTRPPAKVLLQYQGEERELEATWSEATGRTIVRKPDVPMAADWTITLVA